MTTKDLLKAIRLIIREEVRDSIKLELREVKKELREAQSKLAKPVASPTARRKPARSNTNRYGKSPVASLLQEVEHSMRSDGDNDYLSMSPEALMGIPTEGAPAMPNMPPSEPYEAPVEDFDYGDPANAFVKDYSAVLDAADRHDRGE